MSTILQTSEKINFNYYKSRLLGSINKKVNIGKTF